MFVLHCLWNLFVTMIYSDFHIVLHVIRHSQWHVISPFMSHVPFFKFLSFLFSFSSYLWFVSFFSSFYVPWFLGERCFLCKILICCDHLCFKNSISYFKTIVYFHSLTYCTFCSLFCFVEKSFMLFMIHKLDPQVCVHTPTWSWSTIRAPL
jgi:hypothetical protein